MAKQAVVEAVLARLAANFSGAAILNRNRDVLTPTAGTPWLCVEFPVASSAPESLAHTDVETGSFRIVVATGILSGEDASLALCETIAAIFRRQRFAGVLCYAPSIGDGRDDGDAYKRSVIVPYLYPYPAA